MLKNKYKNYIKSHLFIEYYFKKKRLYLLEDLNYYKNINQLLENFGIFKNADSIANIIYKNILNDKLEFKLNNDWLYNIKFIYNNTIIAAYDTKNSKIINNKFNPLILHINKDKLLNDENSVISIIVHELQHAYEDYNRQIKNKENLMNSLLKNNYLKITKYTDDEIKKQINYILYFSNKIEQNAFIAQLVKQIKDEKFNFNSIEEIYNYIKTKTIFKNYIKVLNSIDLFINCNDLDIQNNIINYLNDIISNKFNTYNQVIKFLNNKKEKMLNKFNKIIPKIIYNNISISEFLLPPDFI